MQHHLINLGPSIAPLIQAMQMPAMALSIDGQVTVLNAAAADTLGLSSESIGPGLRFADLLSPPDQVEFASVQARAADGKPIDPPTFALHWRGKAASFVVSDLRDDAGAQIGFLVQQPLDIQTAELLTWQDALLSGDYGLWEIDVCSQVCSYNDDWYRMRGRSRSDTNLTRPDSIFERVHPEDAARLRESLAHVMTHGGDKFSIEFRERHNDGHYLWVLSRGRVVARDTDGNPQRFVGTDTDITQPKTSQTLIDDLTERELRWKVAIQSADQGVWDHDKGSGQRFVSDTWRKMRGMPSEEDVHQSVDAWLADVHPDDIDMVKGEIKRHESGETDVINYQYRQRHRDGHWVWILSRGRVVERFDDGRSARIIGTDTDITEIKKVEEEHEQMSDRLRVAMRAAEMGRWEFNVRDSVAYWDDRLLEMFGVPELDNFQPADFWSTLIHPDDLERATAISEDSVKRGIDLALDYRILRPDGSIVHVRSRAIFVADAKRGDRFVGVNIDITNDILRQEELEAARALLEHESRHDAMTGLTNRRGLDELQGGFLRDFPDQRQAVLHLDLDNFKQINDTLGHGAGDAVLIHAADILRQSARDDWVAARVGGDEFVMLMADAPSDAELAEVAGQIISKMNAPFAFKGQPCNFGVSIGIAVSDRQQAPDASLFVSADLALYAAKADGRGRFRFFDEAMRKTAADRKDAFDALRSGFNQGEIICHYQPQFDAHTLQLTGLEALVRWQSPTRGLIMPDAFLGTAEEMGMIAQFDALVLQRAQHDLQQWQEAGHDVPRVSVNVSAMRLSDPDLIRTLEGMNLAPGKFAFELLESAFLDSYGDELADNLSALRTMGIDVEIDDFGTGHASIVSLLQVSPDRLKIDRQLISPITHSKRQRNLIATIINIGRMQGVAVVAEGVETAEHARILRDLGCDYLQGYALGRPLPFDQVMALLGRLDANAGRLILAA
ncbi:EAL domain-containing protein [Yoonia sp. R2331]|uniref:EAL domain-containing protein n=1 Tax=Yoonia sp. R2331 TaxID=3237238 RepID=UPI0034E4D4A2